MTYLAQLYRGDDGRWTAELVGLQVMAFGATALDALLELDRLATEALQSRTKTQPYSVDPIKAELGR